MFLGCFQDVKERDANIGAFLELSPLSQIFFFAVRTGFEPVLSPFCVHRELRYHSPPDCFREGMWCRPTASTT